MSDHGLSHQEIPADDLTWREQEVLTLLAERMTNREIADRLHLAESTVKDYVGKILSKLYVNNRRQAVERAKALGLLEAERASVIQPTSHLPPEPTPFVGRTGELEQINHCLGETRLLTLTGPGGMGKTRLALKAALGAVDEFKDGVFFVPLAPIQSAGQIIQTIAEALKFPLATHEDPQHQLLRYLRKRQLLLVLDNFEHLLEGVGIISQILQSAPAVKILSTSRERLNLQSESMFNVAGMAFPSQAVSEDSLSYDAIALFLQSASKVRPGFDPSPDELGQIAAICQIVQGMPLAIELAAAWLQLLNLDEIIGELESGLDILATQVRDAPERHRSIRAVFDHSWSLLEPTERDIFLHLSVFRGGFTRQAAERVANASLPSLAALVSKSLLSHNPTSGRLEVHELLRQYAQERLESTLEVRLGAQQAHTAYYAEFVHQSWKHLKGPRQLLALEEIEADIENVRAAWRFSLENRDYPALWKFIRGLWYLYYVRWWNHAGMELFAQAVQTLQGVEDQDAQALRALCMALQAYFMGWLDLADRGYQLAKEGADILEGLQYPEAQVLAYYSLCVNSYFIKRYNEEIVAARKMFAVATELCDKLLLGFSLFGVSMGALLKEDYSEARRLADSHLSLNEETGDRIGSTLPLIILGHAAFAQGELDSARRHYLRCLTISEQVGFFYSIQTSSKYLGKVTLSMGRLAEAEKYLLQSLVITREIGFLRDLVNLLYEFARLQAAQDKPEKAVEVLALILQHPCSQHERMFEGRISDSARELLAAMKDEISPETYEAAMERGINLELEDVVEELIAVGQGSSRLALSGDQEF